MKKPDVELYERLTAARNREFRDLRYQDFIHDVQALETLANRYRQGNP